MATGLSESLLSDSTIYLFGRVMSDIMLDPNRSKPDVYRIRRAGQAVPPDLARRSPNHLLADQLLSPDAAIARIYAFSFQNEYFELVRPALFVVNGPGDLPLWSDGDDRQTEKPLDDGIVERGDERKQREYAFPLGLTGLAQMNENLATDGLRVWAYDRDDYSLRLDIMTGTFDRILIEHEFAEEGLQGFVRGGQELGRPSPTGGRRGRGRRWRSEDD